MIKRANGGPSKVVLEESRPWVTREVACRGEPDSRPNSPFLLRSRLPPLFSARAAAPITPRTPRAAKARAAAATCLLLDLSHDEVSSVTHELCDPLRPLLAVHLSSTAKDLREAMEEQLATADATP